MKHRIKSFFSDFKAFITKGNILDLAIAVVIGAAFGKIVTSLVNDIIMPLITLMVGGVSVTDWKWEISAPVYDDLGNITKAETALMYGNFIQTIIDFLFIAFFIFLALRILMSIQRQWEKTQKGIVELSNKERKKLYKQYKAEGLKKDEILQRIAEQEQLKSEQLKAEQEAQKALEPKVETTEDILKDIRALLSQNNKNADEQSP